MVGSQSGAIQDMLLTSFSNKITPIGFIAEKVFPLVNVVQSTGKLGKYGTSHMRIVDTITGGKNKYPSVQTRSFNTETYSIEKHGLEDIVTEEDYANVQQPFDAERDTTEELITLLQVSKEKGLADTLTDTGVVTQNVTLAGTSQLSDFTNSDPLDDFNTARGTIYSSAGIPPDTVIMSWLVYNTIRFHPALLDKLGFKEARVGGLTDQELARALMVDRILIGAATYESAKENQTSNIQPIWNKDIVFGVLPESVSKRQMTAGYRFQQFGAPRRVFKSAVNNPPNATEILCDDSYDQVISQTGALYLIKDAIA